MVIRRTLWVGLVMLAAASPAVATVSAPGTAPHSIGLAITGWRVTMASPPDQKVECPDGLVASNLAQFKAQFPDPKDREAWIARYASPWNRGPHGENAAYFPETVQDPLPYHEVKGAAAVGLDLDEGAWGQGPAHPLAHEQFVSPTGEQGIDNQFYRASGCQQGWRKGGEQEEDNQNRIALDPHARILIEIDNVTDETNDPDVTVTIMKGVDRLVKDDAGNFIPFLSQRVDQSLPRYVSRLHGRIVDGVLITDPIEAARLPMVNGSDLRERLMRNFRLKLKLGASGASGVVGGYEDLANLWIWITRPWHAVFEIGGWSAPSYWAALQRLADGYPDPVTGKATAISVGYRVDAVRCFIVSDRGGDFEQPLDVARRAAPPPKVAPSKVATRN